MTIFLTSNYNNNYSNTNARSAKNCKQDYNSIATPLGR